MVNHILKVKIMNIDSIQLYVNEIQTAFTGSLSRTLLEFLRDDLGLMGTKNGCGVGHCGACTVLVDGVAKRACLVKMSRVDGAHVETIEGLAKNGVLHPLQISFVNCGAIQCGFCTPGMIISAKGLIDRNPNPTTEDIKKALKHNICRCTGYTKIFDAIFMAAEALREGKTLSLATERKGLGTPVIRQDAVDKAMGKGIYTEDIPEEGSLYGELVLSTCAHGDIISIDTGKAKAIEGVVSVLTGEDIPGPNLIGIISKKQPILATDKVRYMGDAVAMILAESKEIAQRAAKLVEVVYHELPVILDMCKSKGNKSVSIHDTGNVLSELHITRGNIEQGFREADVIVEETITVPAIEHAYLEPDAVYATPHEDGSLTISTQSQSSFSYRDEIAENLELPVDKVRVITRMTGGAFGGREEPTIQVHAALGAMITGRPVHMVMSREDVMLRTIKRHGEILHYRYGAKANGKITAFKADIIADTGAYPSAGEAVILRSVLFAPGPYEIPNAEISGCAVYTNKTPAGAMRGFGSNQPAIASEILMDMLAEKLKMDPLDLRMINGLDTGKQTVGGQVLGESVGLIPSLKIMQQRLKDEQITLDDGRILGLGIASAMKNVGLGSGMNDAAGAIAELCGDHLLLRIASVDSGQGSDTMARQIAAEVMSLNPYDIELITNDTAETIDGGVTTASRQTFVTGNAVRNAVQKLKEKMLELVSSKSGLDIDQLDCVGGLVISRDTVPSDKWVSSFQDLYKEFGNMAVTHIYTAPETVPVSENTDNYERSDAPYRLHFSYCFGTQAAFVAVAPESGSVEVLKVIAVHDAGKVINTHGAQGQIEGGIMMGLGYALSEEFLMDEKGVITNTFKKIGVPTIDMTPIIETVTIDNELSIGPFGAKGMGELPMIPTTPAIINAIYNAVGVRIRDLPAKPEKVRQALAELAQRNIMK
jgi:CO/xanthine dehydrogenase Mo-binding subunit/aerobic-type carbon monoxide dehydrogenase small subunit (CoxS/CutS family)